MGKDVMIKLNHVQKKYPDFSMDCSLTVYPGMITGTDRSEWRRKKYDI